MLTGYKTLFISFISAACGAFLFALADGIFFLRTDNIDQPSISSLQKKIFDLDQQNKTLSYEKDLLQQQLLKVRTTVSLADNKSEQNNSTINHPTDRSPNITTEGYEYKHIQHVENFRHWITDTAKNPNLHIEQEIKKRFDAESINSVWAAQEEQKVMKLFSESAELQGSALKDVKCRSSICEIAISATDIDQANLQFDKTNKALQSLSQTVSIISAPNLEKSVTNLYVTLGDEGFNFN